MALHPRACRGFTHYADERAASGTRTTTTTPAAAPRKFYIDAVQVNRVDDPKILHDADAFVSGATAMLFREAWVIGEIQKKAPNLEYDVAPIPRWTADGPHKTLVGQDGLYVSGKSKNQQAAYDFMKFLTTPESTILLTQKSGWVGARTDVDWSPLLKQIPQYAGFVRQPQDMQFYVDPAISPWNEIETKIANQLTVAYVDPNMQGPAEARRVHPQVRDGYGRDPEGRGHVRHHVAHAHRRRAARQPRAGGQVRHPAAPYRASAADSAVLLCRAAAGAGAVPLCAHHPDRVRVRPELVRWNMISPRKPFMGLANYIQLFGDENFIAGFEEHDDLFARDRDTQRRCWPCRWRSFSPAGAGSRPFYQTIYFLPVITPMIPMSIAWKWIYDYNYGILNYLLSLVGLPAVPWLTDPAIALWARHHDGGMEGHSATHGAVPGRASATSRPNTLEAASIDGATALAALLARHPAAAAADTALRAGHLDDQLLQRVHAGLRDDRSARRRRLAMRCACWSSTSTRTRFQFFHMGYASAEAVMLTMIVLGLTLIQFRARAQRHGEGGLRWSPAGARRCSGSAIAPHTPC